MSGADASIPTDVALAIHIAQFHLERRDLDAARATLAPHLTAPTQSERQRQALSEAYAALALAYIARRKPEAAADAVAQARHLAERPAAWRAAAALATLQGDAAAAEVLRRQVATAERDNAADWQALARACEAAGQTSDAVASYLEAVRLDPTHSTVLAVAQRVAALAPAGEDTPPAQRVRLALIGSSTLDYVRAYLEVYCRLAGLVPEFYVGPFGQYAQDILDPASALYTFAPDIIIAAVHGRDIFPDLYANPFDLPVAARRAAAGAAVERVAGLLGQLTTHSRAVVLWHTFATPQHSPLGTLDLRDEFGQSAIFAAINAGVAERVRRDFPSAHLVDEERVYGRVGKRNVTDPRLWFLARMGIGEGALGTLAAEYLRFIKAAHGRGRKCLVLDLDNTLWGGVVGEDGPHGIKLGQEAPGNAYQAFQEAILDLWKRGIILAIASKNNEADALEVLEHHPDMLLRPRHFAAMRINWLDKATNLEAIAQELNIGLDSLVFVDDNPAETALVRARLPQVLTVRLPQDPALYRGTLLALTDFESLHLTEEDRQRGQLYAQRRERQDWEAHHAEHLDDYLTELGLVVEIQAADEFAIPRIAQLIGKTNQFNLTTRRHSEADVRAFAASADHTVYSVRVRDRFGDHGLVGAAIVARGRDVWEIDTLLMSCRVLGRGVETSFLSALVSAARQSGALAVRGLFIPTAKNVPARDFYSRNGFRLAGEHDGTQAWELDVRAHGVAAPTWLTLQVGSSALVGA